MRWGDVALSAAIGAAVSFLLVKATQPQPRPSRPLEARAPLLNQMPDEEHAVVNDHAKFMYRLIDQLVQPNMTELEAVETRDVLRDTVLGLMNAVAVEMMDSAPPASYEASEL